MLDPKPLTIEDVHSSSYILRELTPGATYQVQAFTVFEGKESAAYTSRNFTTSKDKSKRILVADKGYKKLGNDYYDCQYFGIHR